MHTPEHAEYFKKAVELSPCTVVCVHSFLCYHFSFCCCFIAFWSAHVRYNTRLFCRFRSFLPVTPRSLPVSQIGCTQRRQQHLCIICMCAHTHSFTLRTGSLPLPVSSSLGPDHTHTHTHIYFHMQTHTCRISTDTVNISYTHA